MALSIKNEDLDRKVRRLAALRGTGFTSAILHAVDDALIQAEERSRAAAAFGRLAAIQRAQDLAREQRRTPRAMTDNEILGYDEDGIPSR